MYFAPSTQLLRKQGGERGGMGAEVDEKGGGGGRLMHDETAVILLH